MVRFPCFPLVKRKTQGISPTMKICIIADKVLIKIILFTILLGYLTNKVLLEVVNGYYFFFFVIFIFKERGVL